MDEVLWFVVARMLHVLGVVLWIGGVAFIAMVLLPAIRHTVAPEQRLSWFATVEGRFKSQARVITLITGLSGFFMLAWLHAWDRYTELRFWWVHLMTLIWIIFTLILFVVEPILARCGVLARARQNPDKTLKTVHRMLWFLTALSLLAVLGAVAGVHGSGAF